MSDETAARAPAQDAGFDAITGAVRRRFAVATARPDQPLFTVDAGDLYALYIDNLPEGERQAHRCACCRRFFERFGHLASIAEDGSVASVLWDPAGVPQPYAGSIQALERAVARGRVTGVFVAPDEDVWGTGEAGGRTHFSLTPSPDMGAPDPVLAPGQRMAAKREDHRELSAAIARHGRAVVAQALTFLEASGIYRRLKIVGSARRLLAIHDATGGKPEPVRERLIWRAVATAPVDFRTSRSSLLGTLLDDIASGLNFGTVGHRFAVKMHPVLYCPTTAAPSASYTAHAERLIAEQGLEPSLHRRFARLDEVQTIWRPPVAPAAKRRGIVRHLTRGSSPRTDASDLPAQPITWVNLVKTVLPAAQRIEVHMEQQMNFAATITAENRDAPPLLQWDREGDRNPFSWCAYRYISPAHWGLGVGTWVMANAVMRAPFLWSAEHACPDRPEFAVIVLHGAKARREKILHLYPDVLRLDLRPIELTILAYSNTGEISGRETASASGIIVGPDYELSPWRDDMPFRLRVTSPLGVCCYRINRWD